MKDFLLYLHSELSRLLIKKSSSTLEKADEDLLQRISETVSFLESFAEISKDGRLYGIVEDLEYSIRHLWIPFKAEAALKDVEKNIIAHYE